MRCAGWTSNKADSTEVSIYHHYRNVKAARASFQANEEEFATSVARAKRETEPSVAPEKTREDHDGRLSLSALAIRHQLRLLVLFDGNFDDHALVHEFYNRLESSAIRH